MMCVRSAPFLFSLLMYAEPVILPKMENDVVGQVGCKFLIALGRHTERGWGKDVPLLRVCRTLQGMTLRPWRHCLS
jgi:hypothetical protein